MSMTDILEQNEARGKKPRLIVRSTCSRLPVTHPPFYLFPICQILGHLFTHHTLTPVGGGIPP